MKIKDMDSINENIEQLPPPKKLDVEFIQPWSNFICKVKLPDEIFVELQKVYDETSKLNKSFGSQLVGQINNEPEVTLEIQEKFPEQVTGDMIISEFFGNSKDFIATYIAPVPVATASAYPPPINLENSLQNFSSQTPEYFGSSPLDL